MNKPIIAAVLLFSIMLAGCRTTGGAYYPNYNPAEFQGDEQAAQQEYLNNTLEWQKEQQKKDKLYNDGRIKNRRKPWWRWW